MHRPVKHHKQRWIKPSGNGLEAQNPSPSQAQVQAEVQSQAQLKPSKFGLEDNKLMPS